MAKRLAVIVAQGNSSNPVKRQLEEDIITQLMFSPGIDVTVIPSLYDLKPDSTGMLALRGISGDLVVCSWLYERAAGWVLDRNQISGRIGTTTIGSKDDDEDEEEDEEEMESASKTEKPRVAEKRQVPDRWIYCLDLKTSPHAETYVAEVLRIQREMSVSVVSLTGPGNAASSRESNGRSMETSSANGSISAIVGAISNGSGEMAAAALNAASVQRFEDPGSRRWYPVIDYSRCTNCLECIDFCLFGVYGIDRIDTILVEQPDNCRKGCPACSRVCPENAIMFPQHKTPAIAGSNDAASSLKIDLSQLFGAPDQGKSAAEIAAIERDEQLVLAGRQAVGLTVPERRHPSSRNPADRDELDALVDQLDKMDL
jgi:NAD-dependent dihydropyrimidine dehydrogenase PreA subunit